MFQVSYVSNASKLNFELWQLKSFLYIYIYIYIFFILFYFFFPKIKKILVHVQHVYSNIKANMHEVKHVRKHYYNNPELHHFTYRNMQENKSLSTKYHQKVLTTILSSSNTTLHTGNMQENKSLSTNSASRYQLFVKTC